jgi:hypothetical protein
MTDTTVYAACKVALLTQHGKEKVLAPVLEPGLGCRIEHVTGFDTDQLGTFTREIPRHGTQIEAARRKARIGMDRSGLRLGLASEGAFGPDPISGMLPWNVEHLLWIDDERGLEVIGRAQGPACFAHRLTSSWDSACEFAQQVGFPDQYIVMRAGHQDDPRIRKDIHAWDAFAAQFQALSAMSDTGQVFIETDSRAHANPTRQAMIARAADDLLQRLCMPCPACGLPGFGRVESLPGLPCADCGAPTSQPYADRYRCPTCAHDAIREREGPASADPGRCPCCNP